MTFKGYKLLNLCLIFILSHWFVIIESFIPVGRYAHSSVLVGEKLYFFGGMNDDFKCLNEVFYLDVSRPFNSAVPPWVDLTQNAGLPFKSCWATVSLNYKEQIIYLFGGFMLKDTNQDAFESSVYSFDLNTVRWNIPNIRGILPRRRRKIKSIIDDNTGKIYIFGGQALIATTLTLLNDMVILNTVESSWLNNPPVNSPSIRTGYTATLLKNGIIAYIGGIEMIEVNTTRLVDINRIYLYDTKSLTWSVKIARSSNIIENRNGHAAVLAPNDEIIIYGGSRGIGINERVVPDLFVLNTNTEQFEFTIPPVTSKIGQVPSITIHTADLVVNYMIVAFGNITQPNSNPLSLRNPNIYIMDIRNYTWVDSFDPTNMGTKTNPSAIQPSSFTNDLNKDLVTLKIVIGSIGAILCVIIIIVCGFLIYRWNAKKKEQSPTTISTAPVTSIGHNDQNDKEHNLSEVII